MACPTDFARHWQPDPLLAGYQQLSWVIDGASFAEGEPTVVPLRATLVRQHEPRHRRAVIYVHGWNDYFFQTHVADFFDAHGFDWYALELRRYGRNLTPGLFAGYITSLHDYSAELDAAYHIVAHEGHDATLLFGHSTGGLTAALWAARTELPLLGLVLNSPWLDMHGSGALWKALAPLISSVAAVKPTTALTLSDPGFYRRSVFDTEGGQWHVDPNLKSNPGFVIRFGWGRAILAGQAEVAAGLGIKVPVLSLMSDRSNFTAREWDDQLRSVDIILDVNRLAAASVRLGELVTVARIIGGMHDLALSEAPARARFFEQIGRWLAGYVDSQENAVY